MIRRKIVWTLRSRIELLELIDYLSIEWSEATVESVLDKIERLLFLASRMPYIFPKHPKLKHRYFIINGLTRVYYKTGKTKIEVVALYDNRRDNRNYQG
jgi:plasmid stabilization system protein ParE